MNLKQEREAECCMCIFYGKGGPFTCFSDAYLCKTVLQCVALGLQQKEMLAAEHAAPVMDELYWILFSY